MSKIIKLFSFFLYLGFSTVIQASTYYFSSSIGSDTYTTAQAQNQSTPWQTLTKLNSMMSTLKAGDKVLLKRGDTFVGPITVTASGTLNNPIVFSSFGTGSKPVIDNRLVLTSWVNVGANLWEVSNSSFNGRPTALMMDNVLKPLGRYPNSSDLNSGYLTVDSHPTDSLNEFTDPFLVNLPDWTGAEIVIRTNRWMLDKSVVNSQSAGRITFTPKVTNLINNYGYFFQNHPAALDKEGEWCYIATGNKVRLFSTVNPNTRIVSVANIDIAINITSKSYIAIDGLKIVGAKLCAIKLYGATYGSVRNCDFVNSGTNDILIGKMYSNTYADSISVCNNTFSLSQSTSIIANGTRMTFSGNTFNDIALVAGMGETGNNYMGLYANVNGLLIERNRFDNIGYLPVHFLWSSNVIVNQNVIDKFCSVEDDGAGIYCYTGTHTPAATNRKITNNVITNGIGAVNGTNNAAYIPANGIYMDDNSENVEVTGNTIAFCPHYGINFHNSPNCSAKNNTIFACNQYININHDNSASFVIQNCDVQDNTLVSNDLYAEQSLLYFNTLNASEMALFGVLDNNIYCQPFSKNDYVYFKTATPVIKSSMNLREWQTFSNYDLQTKLSPVSFPAYSVIDTTNGIANGTFTSNTTGWRNWSPLGNVSTITNVPGKLTGKCLAVNITGADTVDNSWLKYSLPPITAGKTYLLKLTALGTVNSILYCQLLASTSPYVLASQINTYNLSTKILEKEMLYKATVSATAPQLFFSFKPNNGTFYLDNLVFYEVTPTVVNDYVRFEYNTTATAKTITADKNYITPTGVTYALGSNFTVPAYGSIVLLYNKNPSTENLPTKSSELIPFYWNSVEKKLVFNADATGNLSIFDSFGLKISSEKIFEKTTKDLNCLNSGIYVAKWTNGQQNYILKFIK